MPPQSPEDTWNPDAGWGESGDNRAPVYEENGGWVYRASSVGRCVSELVAWALGYGPELHPKAEEILMNAAHQGNIHEPALVEKLNKTGFKIGHSQEEYDLDVVKGVKVRIHIDGRGGIPKGKKERVFEFKTMSQDVFREWSRFSDFDAALKSERFFGYGVQASIAMEATGLPLVYVVLNRNTGEDVMDELIVPPVSWGDIKKRVLKVEAGRRRGKVPECLEFKAKGFFCPFPRFHEKVPVIGAEDEDEDGEVVTSAQMAIVGAIAEEYLELTPTVRKGDAAKKKRKEVSQKLLQSMPGKRVNAGGIEVLKVPGKMKGEIDWRGIWATIGTVIDAVRGRGPSGELSYEEFKKIVDDHTRVIEYEYPKVTDKRKEGESE